MSRDRGILVVGGSAAALFRLLAIVLVLGWVVPKTALAGSEPESQPKTDRSITPKDFFKSFEGAIPITVLVTAIGWIVTSYLNRRGADRTRKLEKRLNHYQKQVEEFYGPLFNLVHQIFLVNHTLFAIVTAKNEDDTPCLTEEQGGEISDYFYKSISRSFMKR
jgi:hypothetical protein